MLRYPPIKYIFPYRDGEMAQVTGGCDWGGKPPRTRLGEHDGLNLTWNNRTFCGVLCARSVLTLQNECQATMCALSTGTTLASFEPSVYYRKLTRTGERRVRGRSGNDTNPRKFDRLDTLTLP